MSRFISKRPAHVQEPELVKRESEASDLAIDKLVYEMDRLTEYEIKILEGG